jgi:hypothetical protein
LLQSAIINNFSTIFLDGHELVDLLQDFNELGVFILVALEHRLVQVTLLIQVVLDYVVSHLNSCDGVRDQMSLQVGVREVGCLRF